MNYTVKLLTVVFFAVLFGGVASCKKDPAVERIDNLFRPVFSVSDDSEDLGEIDITWRWYQVNAAVSYTFQVSTSSSQEDEAFLAGMVAGETDMSEAWTFEFESKTKRYKVTGLQPQTVYYARIKSNARKSENDSKWSYSTAKRTGEYTGTLALYMAGTTDLVPNPYEWEYDDLTPLEIDVSTSRGSFEGVFSSQAGWLGHVVDQLSRKITLTPSGENPGGTPRTATMTISIDDNYTSRTISFVQKKKMWRLSSTVGEVIFDNNGNVTSAGGAVATVSTDCPDGWTAEAVSLAPGADVSWCSPNPPSGAFGDSNLTVSASPYPGADPRSAYVVITAGTGEMIARDTILVTQTGSAVYTFDIPDFSRSYVYKVLSGGVQIAEICKEYLRSGYDGGMTIDAQAIVVYPMLATGKADLTKGFVVQVNAMSGSAGSYSFNADPGQIHGGNVAFDKTGNTMTSYMAGTSDAPATGKVIVYADGTFAIHTDEATLVSIHTTEPYLLVDMRGTETNSYKLTKIGTQYWLAENYRSMVTKTGAAIPFYWMQTDATISKPDDPLYVNATEYTSSLSNSVKRAPGIIILNNNINGELANYGIMYTSHTFGFARDQTANENYNDSSFSPTGWKIPTNAHWILLSDYLGATSAGLKLNADHSDWIENRGNNMTGFSNFPCGRMNNDATYADVGTTAFIWATTIQSSSNSYAARVRSDLAPSNNQAGERFCAVRMLRMDD